MYCTQCGIKLVQDSNVCPSCGSTIKKGTHKLMQKWEYLTVKDYFSCSVSRWKSQSISESIERRLLAMVGKGVKVTVKDKGTTVRVQGCSHEEFLDVLGSEGWEFAGVSMSGFAGSTDSILYFKRRLVT